MAPGRYLPVLILALSACAVSVGVRPSGPGLYTVSERRAAFLGGGPEAQRAALAEATGFCRQQGGVFTPVAAGPVGNPYGAYGPTGYATTFRCPQAVAR